MKYSYQLCLLGLFIQLFPGVAYAQILPDSTVGTKLTSNALINGDRIDGGALRGSNLFHSFQEFNINAGRSVFFTNPADVTNIFTRVTGTNPSNINGTLGVLGNANLFFMNPNGIVFGTAGKLDVKGSFLGTTASSINFADASVFSSTPNSSISTPLLSVTVPVGLGFGSNPGAIKVQGVGHNLTSRDLIFSPYTSLSPTTTGLQVQPGKTLALVGSEVNLNGGILTAPGGRIEVGAVAAASQVNLNPATWGFTLNYTKAPSLQNIQLSRQALLNVSGSTASSAGSIQLQGKRISLNDGSTLWSQNRAAQAGGDINVHATELLELSGTTTDEKIRSGIMSETLGRGASSNINISTAKLTMQNGTVINSKTFGSAPSGNININATDSVQMRGLSPKTRAYNVIGSLTFFTSGSFCISKVVEQM
ncbi:MAG: filamentous hemagglutinin N-terminal domain-containing protein [Scytonematopsis contorta HA4267-MV1]|jgi:filamentous hemagglutinin family protein|nr:filamentous hemagglutinin N-terminal domain-containing protein [Scytonematopsis contorta HA4267-MV1]